MKNIVKIGLMMSVIAVVFASVGAAYAASPAPQLPGGNGRGGNGGAMGGGMGSGTSQPLELNLSDELDESMHAALADAVGLTVSELEARLDAGETYVQIAISAGYTLDEAQELLAQARSEALAEAVAAGIITQAQADFLNSRGAGMAGGQGMSDGQGSAYGMGARRGGSN